MKYLLLPDEPSRRYYQRDNGTFTIYKFLVISGTKKLKINKQHSTK